MSVCFGWEGEYNCLRTLKFYVMVRELLFIFTYRMTYSLCQSQQKRLTKHSIILPERNNQKKLIKKDTS